MENNPAKKIPPPNQDLTARLRKATDTLHTFSQESLKRQKQSGLSKTVALMKGLLDRALGRKQKQQRDEVLHAVEVINSQRLAIRSLDHESIQSITKAVDAYNACHEIFPTTDKTKSLPKIAIPKRLRPVERHFPAQRLYKVATPALKNNKIHSGLSTQTSELFHMKVISLLERYGIASNPEARLTVKNSPISISLNIEDHLCTLTQTFQLFPWQTITIQGTSKVDPITQAIRHLLPDSFSLSLITLQTAFPHPLQRAGWSLADQLLPEVPQRPYLIPQIATLFDLKRQLQESLLSNEKSIISAKNLFKYRRQAFKENSKELLTLHRKQAQAVIAAALGQRLNDQQDLQKAFEAFFLAAENDIDPYGFLGETYDLLRDIWITRPYNFVIEEIARIKMECDGEMDDIFNDTVNLFEKAYDSSRLEIAEKIASCADNKLEAQWIWIQHYGALIGSASRNIMMQHLSEDLGFAPPELTLFETQLQTSAYRQLIDFVDEMQEDERGEINSAKMYLMMKDQIESDTRTFEDKAPTGIALDLAAYFNRSIGLNPHVYRRENT
jgi:hypothetical protein